MAISESQAKAIKSLTPYQQKVFRKFNERRTAYFYPRKKRISISGKPSRTIPVAIREMKETLKRDGVKI